MSERKVLNKYYPADYDPSKIPKGKRNKNATFNIRIMAPFNMRCNMCKEYIYKGKKFNSRKEDVMDETYLGLKIFRFYIKCPRCVSEIAFKTDLENTDYTLEAGAKRLFEAEKIAHKMAEEERKAKEDDELNPMKLLENRTKASRAEMDQIDALEELREMNSRKNQVNTDAMIEKYRKYEELLAQLQMEKEEEELRDIFGEKGTKIVKRLDESDSEDDGPPRKKLAVLSGSKPTDILAEVSKSESTKKPPASWQKSVGSLSSKQKLKGLVVRKKSSALLPVSSTVTSASANSIHASDNVDKTEQKDVTLGGDVGKSHVGAVDANTEVIQNSESGNVDKIKDVNWLAKDATHSKIMSSRALENVAEKSTNLVSSSNQAGNKSALSLIGGYSDSDSDSSI